MDSEGIIRMMNTSLASSWSQVASTREQLTGKSDHYWIVSVHENPQQLSIALCEQETEKSQYEEQYLRSVLFTQHLTTLAADGVEVDEDTQQNLQRPAQESLVKLFALSARSGREFRAMEVCNLMPDEQTLQLSIKYATRQRLLQLAQRISQLAHSRALQEQQVEEEDDVSTEYSLASHSSETSWLTAASLKARREEEEEDVEQEEERKPSGPMLNVKPKEKFEKKSSFARMNPFKVSSQELEPQPGIKGSHVFDNMKKVKERAPVISPLPVSVKQTKGEQKKIVVKSKQPQLSKMTFAGGDVGTPPAPKEMAAPETEENMEQSENQPTKKPSNAFELWLLEHQNDLHEEHPDLSQEELNRMATEKFRALPRADRQVWLQKFKSQTQTDDSEPNKKRKRSEEKDDEVPSKAKKIASGSPTKTPLSQSTNSKLAAFAFSTNQK